MNNKSIYKNKVPSANTAQSALLLSFALAFSVATAQKAQASTAASKQSASRQTASRQIATQPTAPRQTQETVLSLNHLKNGSYQVSDSACGYTTVRLANGKGEADGIEVVFGRAQFGQLRSGRAGAVVHLAYKSDTFGWLQEVVFIEVQNNELVQVAEHNLDDRDELKSIDIKRGEITLETASPDSINHEQHKVTKIKLAEGQGGSCTLQSSEWLQDRSTNQLKPYVDLAPYLSTVEERIGKCWAPTCKDRSEHVVVSFKIRESGTVEDIQLNNSSEVATADLSAIQAIENAAPFAPLPPGTDGDVGVCFDFQAEVARSR